MAGAAARWVEDARLLGSLADVEAAEQEGALTLENTDIVINAALVKWSDGELPADIEERTQYLGPGQLLAPPDTDKMEVTFKLPLLAAPQLHTVRSVIVVGALPHRLMSAASSPALNSRSAAGEPPRSRSVAVPSRSPKPSSPISSVTNKALMSPSSGVRCRGTAQAVAHHRAWPEATLHQQGRGRRRGLRRFASRSCLQSSRRCRRYP